MSIPLPVMNNLCKRWTLPLHFQKACDFYFLRQYADAELGQLIFQDEEGKFFIQEYGVNFQVLFMYESLNIFLAGWQNGKLKEPNNTSYWLSFRSLTFNYHGKETVKSFVLVQVDKKETKLRSDGAKPLSVPVSNVSGISAAPARKQVFKSFAELSLPIEKDED